jgi:hypothetical protein
MPKGGRQVDFPRAVLNEHDNVYSKGKRLVV